MRVNLVLNLATNVGDKIFCSIFEVLASGTQFNQVSVVSPSTSEKICNFGALRSGFPPMSIDAGRPLVCPGGSMANQVPVGLEHVLNLFRLTCRDRCERSAAVRQIARMKRIALQSVMSACTRGIGINTSQLDQFLKRDSAKVFCLHLVQRYPGHCDYIESFFDEVTGVARDKVGAATQFEALLPGEKQQVLRILVLKDAEVTISRWLEENSLPHSIRNEARELSNRISAAASF